MKNLYYEKIDCLLNEEECRMVGYPVKENEKPKIIEQGEALYNREDEINLYAYSVYGFDEIKYYFKDEEDLQDYLHTNLIKTTNYVRNGCRLMPLYDEETLTRETGFPVLFDPNKKDIKPYHWQGHKLEILDISTEEAEICALVVSDYSRKNGFYYDCRNLLETVGEKFITTEQYDEEKNFRNLTNKDIERLPKKWFSKELKYRQLGYLDSETIFYRIEDNKKNRTGFGKILLKNEIDKRDSIIDIREFDEFKKMINEKKKPISSVVFKGVTEDFKGVFDISNVYKPIVKVKRKGGLTFDYLENSFPLLIKAGDVAAHEIVRDHLTVRSVKSINEMNRIHYAEKLINRVSPRLLKGNYEKTQLIKDIAMFIDQRVPLAYSKYIKGEKSASPKFGLAAGLTYQFRENEEEVKKPIVKSDKQSVKNTTVKTDNKNTGEIDARDLRNNNYNNLIEFLNKKGKRTKGDEFKAILNVINGMTVGYKTKSEAIKEASGTFNIKQKFLKDIIKDMGIQSTRNIQIKKQFGQMVAIETKLLKD
jgi:hypothetical protein